MRHICTLHAAVNKISLYHPTILAFCFFTTFNRFKPQVWQKQVFAGRNPTLAVTKH